MNSRKISRKTTHIFLIFLIYLAPMHPILTLSQLIHFLSFHFPNSRGMKRHKKSIKRLSILSTVIVTTWTLLTVMLFCYVLHLGKCSVSDAPLPFTSGASGELFTMTPRRGQAPASKVFTQQRKIASIDSAPLFDAFQLPFPICEVWTVITSINPPTKIVEQLAALPEMCVCIVADLKSPQNYAVKNIVYLTPDVQRRLPYETIHHLPWNHFGRKNLGYLFAIHHGATVIYDTDDDNELTDDALLPHLNLHEIDEFLSISLKENLAAVNPYPFFGAPLAWPRGFPMDKVRASTRTNATESQLTRKTDETKQIGVIQSLANHDPDIDAVYRLSSLPLPFHFSSNKGKVVGLETRKTLVPYNAQATIHRYGAFWLMLLPISVHGRVSDIWRSYFAQRLFRETGEVVAFASPWVTQYRNIHNYLADFNAEQDLYHKSTALVDFLANKWQCQARQGKTDAAFFTGKCLEQLYQDMYIHGILEEADMPLVKAWIDDLKSIGYTFPLVK